MPSDVNARCEKEGNALLHYAAKLGNLDVVSFMTAAGADPMAQNKLRETPLMEAFYRGKQGG
jgi:ankyrin repeat protein